MRRLSRDSARAPSPKDEVAHPADLSSVASSSERHMYGNPTSGPAFPSSDSMRSERSPPELSAVKESVQLSETELNQINAKILRAELMGNIDLVSKLKSQKAASSKASPPPVSKRSESVVLSRTHAKGFNYPVMDSGGPVHGSLKTSTHNKSGVRDRYFADDDKYSLNDLVRMERMQSAEDQNGMFARVAEKVIEKTDEDYVMDDVFMRKALKKETLDQMSLRDRDKAIMEHRKHGSALSACSYCLDGPKILRHLVIAVGKKVILMMSPSSPIVEGHCILCPIQHVLSGTLLDEDVWEEMLDFRRALCKMFESKGMDCVFMETAMNLKSHPHMRLECIPLEKDVGSSAPMYFRKAIMEAEGEWTQNVKLVDLKRKDVRRAVGKQMCTHVLIVRHVSGHPYREVWTSFPVRRRTCAFQNFKLIPGCDELFYVWFMAKV